MQVSMCPHTCRGQQGHQASSDIPGYFMLLKTGSLAELESWCLTWRVSAFLCVHHTLLPLQAPAQLLSMDSRDLDSVLPLNSKVSYLLSYLPSLQTTRHLGKIILYEIDLDQQVLFSNGVLSGRWMQMRRREERRKMRRKKKRKKEGRAEVRRLCTALSYVNKGIRKHSILYAPLSLDHQRLSAQQPGDWWP